MNRLANLEDRRENLHMGFFSRLEDVVGIKGGILGVIAFRGVAM